MLRTFKLNILLKLSIPFCDFRQAKVTKLIGKLQIKAL